MEMKAKRKKSSGARVKAVKKPVPEKAEVLETAIIRRDDDKAMIPDSSNLEKLGKFLYQSKLFPAIGSISGAITIIEYGRELGLKPVQALQTMSIVKGRVCIEAKALLALAIQKGLTYKAVKSDNEICQLEFKRPGFEPHVETFTAEDAKRAKLTDKTSYVHYPRIMNFWRCVSNGIRAYAPDLALGLYSKEEIETEDTIEVHVEPDVEKQPQEDEKERREEAEKEEVVEDIKYILAEESIDIKEFKKFLENFQSEGTKEPRDFVGYKFGNLSFHEGKLPDLKLLKKNIAYAVNQFRAWKELQSKEEKNGGDKEPF